MSYLLKTKPKKNPSIRRALVIISSVLLFLFFLFAFSSRVPSSFLSNIGEPFWKVSQSARNFLSTNSGFFKSKRAIVDENDSLRKELLELSIASLERDLLKIENEELKSIQNGLQEPARVLSSPVHAFYDLFIIELSSDSRANVGDLVFAKEVVLLGKIFDKEGNIARVKLFSSPGMETPMRLVSSGTELTLSGRGGGNFFVTVPSSIPIKDGDLFSFPSFATNVVSKVGSVVQAQADSFNNVLSSYPINIFEISWVGIRYEQ